MCASAPLNHQNRQRLPAFAIKPASVLGRLFQRLVQHGRDEGAQQLAHIMDVARAGALPGQYLRVVNRVCARRATPELLSRVDGEAGLAHGFEERAALIHFGIQRVGAALAGRGGQGIEQLQTGAIVSKREGARREVGQLGARRGMVMADIAELSQRGLRRAAGHISMQRASGQERRQQRSLRRVVIQRRHQRTIQQDAAPDQAHEMRQVCQL